MTLDFITETDLLPEWINTGLQECLRFRDAFDENILRIQGVASDKDRFYVLYTGYKRSLKDYLNDKSIVSLRGLSVCHKFTSLFCSYRFWKCINPFHGRESNVFTSRLTAYFRCIFC
jgi:hypothetical protein